MIQFIRNLIISHLFLVKFLISQSQSESENNNLMGTIVIMFAEMFWSFILVLMVCFSGEKVSDAFEVIEHEIYQFDWYRFPIHMWQSLSILLVGVQQPASLYVFGSISCDREAFKKVNN